MKKLPILLLAASLCISGCACAKPFTEKDNGKTVNLSTDDPFEVVLKGNPTTGYTWELEPFDTTVVKQLGEPNYQAERQAIGAGGLYTFRFQSVADGQTTLKFIYHRTFEKEIPPIQTFELKVVVGTMGQILE